MIAMQCDRCGKYFTEPYASSTVYLYWKHLYTRDKKMDLCPECCKKLEEWFREEMPEELARRLR